MARHDVQDQHRGILSDGEDFGQHGEMFAVLSVVTMHAIGRVQNDQVVLSRRPLDLLVGVGDLHLGTRQVLPECLFLVQIDFPRFQAGYLREVVLAVEETGVREQLQRLQLVELDSSPA